MWSAMCSFCRCCIRFGSESIIADCAGISSVTSIARSGCSCRRRIYRIWCVFVICVFRCEERGVGLGVGWNSIIRNCNIDRVRCLFSTE